MADVTMWFLVEGYDPIAQTISELGAGPHAWLQDTGLTLFAVGVAALLVAFALAEAGSRNGWITRVALGALAVAITVIALRNAYGDNIANQWEVHREMVILTGLAVPAILWFAPKTFSADGRVAKASRIVAIVWLIAAPLFFFMPEDINGIYERVLAGVMVASVLVAAISLLRYADELEPDGLDKSGD